MRGTADPALIPGSAPKAAKSPGAGSCRLSPILWDPSSVQTPGDPKPQGPREPDPGPRVRETANGPGRWGGVGGGSLGVGGKEVQAIMYKISYKDILYNIREYSQYSKITIMEYNLLKM